MIRRLFASIAAAATLVVTPAAAALTCGTSAEVLDWDSGTNAWTAGSLSNNYTVGNDTIGVAFTGSTGRLLNIFGQQTPFKSTDLTGGLTPTEQNLLFVVNYVDTTETLTLTITAGATGVGVRELEFTIFDLDTDSATAPFQFQDQINVTGTLNGVSVGNPTFTSGVSNTATGNTATGTNASGNTAGDGNMTIKFSSAVDRVVIVYRAGPNSIADPAQQGMALHDISFCPANTDYGDAPSSYGAPSHRIASGVALGSGNPDADLGAQNSSNADGDDNSGIDDENGVTIGTMTVGAAATISANVQGSGGRLQGWIDWNGDGDFLDSGEQIATNLQDNGIGDTNLAAGAISFAVSVPATATTLPTYGRFRWSTVSGLTAVGSAANGEVEDYIVNINPASGAPSCPAGQLLINQSGYAASQTSSGVGNPTFALGTLSAAGTTPPDPVAAIIDDSSDQLVVDLGVRVPQNGTITLSAARNGGNRGNTAMVTIEVSTDNVSFTTLGSYGTTPATYISTVQDVLERNNLVMPSGGARYLRFTTQDNDDIFIDGLQYGQVCLASPTLAATKSVTVYNPTGTTPFALPGNDVVYALTVQNSGSGTVDSNSLFIVDTLPAQVTFYNGDMDGTGPATGAVYFTQANGAGLTFTLATDAKYSSSATRPTNFAACTYAPAPGYDANVKHVCLNPKGTMGAGTPNPSFTAQFRVQIK